MKPRRTPFSNQVFTLPGGNEDSDLWTQRDESEDGTPLIRSVWELTDAEREEIIAGANVELIVWGDGTPPVLLQITDVPIGAHHARD